MNEISIDHKKYLKKIRIEKILILGIQLLIIIIFISCWEFMARKNIINTFLFSSPSKIIKTIINLLLKGSLFSHIYITFLEVIMSIFISFIIGILIAIISWFFPIIFKIIDPYLTILNSLPKVALGPLIIIWFGANTNSIVFMSLLISTFVTIINIYTCFIHVPDSLLTMSRSFGASRWQTFKYIVFPYNINHIITSLKVNISLNLIGVIMGELLVSKKGLGYLIMYGSQVFNLDLVITCIIVLGIISYILYFFINKIK